MKQLLTWCGTRAMEETPLHASDEDTGTLVGELAWKTLAEEAPLIWNSPSHSQRIIEGFFQMFRDVRLV